MGALRLTYKENYRPLKVVRGNFYLQKNSDAERYEFGFNGQLKDNEIYGDGNAYDYGDREYDPRSVRRWNVDPVIKHHESPYAAFANNPILLIDPNGDDAEVADPPGKRNKSKNTNEGFDKKKLYSELPRVVIKKDNFDVTYTKENTLLKPTEHKERGKEANLVVSSVELTATSPETKEIGFTIDVDIFHATADITVSRIDKKGKEKVVFQVIDAEGVIVTPNYKVNRPFGKKDNFKIEATYQETPLPENKTTFERPEENYALSTDYAVTAKSRITYKIRKTIHATPERIEYLKNRNIIER